MKLGHTLNRSPRVAAPSASSRSRLIGVITPHAVASGRNSEPPAATLRAQEQLSNGSKPVKTVVEKQSPAQSKQSSNILPCLGNIQTKAMSAEVEGLYQQVQGQKQPIDKYIWLRDLHAANKSDYFRLMLEKTQEVMPFIYTPTVGEACQKYHSLPLQAHGLYLRIDRDKGKILDILKSLPQQEVRVGVVTDGERILGLGDLGANGMGISEGKITLYTAAAGVDPRHCLPICLDVGTNNDKLLADPTYKGVRQRRPKGPEYYGFVAEFMDALKQWRPNMLLQFEDFGNHTAFHLLSKYRSTHCCFNDDIQGTASICLAALLAAMRVTGGKLDQQRILFMGAGEAGTGIGELIAYYLHKRVGITLEAARKHCFFMDSQGLICRARGPVERLQEHKRAFAHDGVPYQRDLKSAIQALKPTALIGVSTMPGAFDREVVELMGKLNERPIIMPLSNPTSKSECTFKQALEWSKGKVVFASGSPFEALTDEKGQQRHPAQANNAYIFPSVGHAAVLVGATCIPDEVFAVAAQELSQLSSIEEIEAGHLFPNLSHIRTCSHKVMARVASYLVEAGLGLRPEGVETHEQWMEYCEKHMWGTADALKLAPGNKL